MITIAHNKANTSQIRNRINVIITNIKYHRIYSLKVNSVMCSRAINETIRLVDAITYKEQYAKYKSLNNYELIEIEERACFKVGVMAGVLKCYYGINQYGNRDKQISPNKTEEYL